MGLLKPEQVKWQRMNDVLGFVNPNDPNMAPAQQSGIAWPDGLDTSSFYRQPTGNGDNSQPGREDPAALKAWLDANNYSLMGASGAEATGSKRGTAVGIQDAQGNWVVPPQMNAGDPKFFRDAALVLGGGYLAGTALTGGFGAAAGGATEAGAAAGGGSTATGGSGALSLMGTEAAPTIASMSTVPTLAPAAGTGMLTTAGQVGAGAGSAKSLVGGGDTPTGYGTGGTDPNLLTGGGNALTGGTNTGVPPGEGFNFGDGTDYLSQLVNGAGTVLSGKNLFANSLLGLVGAGVQQYSLEKIAKDNREFDAKQDAEKRVRQAPTGGGMLASINVKKGLPNAIGR